MNEGQFPPYDKKKDQKAINDLIQEANDVAWPNVQKIDEIEEPEQEPPTTSPKVTPELLKTINEKVAEKLAPLPLGKIVLNIIARDYPNYSSGFLGKDPGDSENILAPLKSYEDAKIESEAEDIKDIKERIKNHPIMRMLTIKNPETYLLMKSAEHMGRLDPTFSKKCYVRYLEESGEKDDYGIKIDVGPLTENEAEAEIKIMLAQILGEIK